MSAEQPHKQEIPSREKQPEQPESVDPAKEREARIQRVESDKQKTDGKARTKISDQQKDNPDTAKEQYETALKNYKLSYEDAQNAILKHMESLTARIKELDKDQRKNDFGKDFNSIFLVGGLFGKTVRQAEQEEMQQLLKTYNRAKQDLEDLQRFSGNPSQNQIDKWFNQLKKFRQEIGLPALPPNVVENYDEQQRMIQETRDAGYGYDVDYLKINEGLAASETAFDKWDTVIKRLDDGAGILAGMIPYGSEVYGLSKELTNVATGLKTPGQAAEDFVIGEIGSRIGGKLGEGLKKGLFKVGGKFASSALAKKFGSKIAGAIVKEIEKRAPAYASRFTKEFAEKALSLLGQVGEQAIEGSARGAVSGAVESTIHSVSDKYIHCKDKPWFGILYDALAAAGSGAATGAVVGPIGAQVRNHLDVQLTPGTSSGDGSKNNSWLGRIGSYLNQRIELRAFPNKKNQSKFTSITPDDVLSIPDTPQGKTLRLAVAQEILDADGTGPGLTPQQQERIWEAHRAETIPEKARILAEGDMFNKEQRRALMEWGVCGNKVPATFGPPPPAPPPRKIQPAPTDNNPAVTPSAPEPAAPVAPPKNAPPPPPPRKPQPTPGDSNPTPAPSENKTKDAQAAKPADTTPPTVKAPEAPKPNPIILKGRDATAFEQNHSVQLTDADGTVQTWKIKQKTDDGKYEIESYNPKTKEIERGLISAEKLGELNRRNTVPIPEFLPENGMREPFKKGEEVYVVDAAGIPEKGWFIRVVAGKWVATNKQSGQNVEFDSTKILHIQEIEKPTNKPGDMPESKVQKMLQRRQTMLEEKATLPKDLFQMLFSGELRQTNVGNCYLIAGFASMRKSPHFEAMIRTSMRYGDGGYYVKFPLGGKDPRPEIFVAHADIYAQKLEPGTDARGRSELKAVNAYIGWRVLEAAYVKSVTGGEMAREKTEGGNTGRALTKIFGNENNSTLIYEPVRGYQHLGRNPDIKSKSLEFLDNFHNSKDICAAGSLPKPEGSNSHSYRVDAKGGKIPLYHNHAYSIESVDKVNKTVTLKNPHNTKNALVFTYDQFLNAFSTISGASLDYNNMFPSQ